MPKREWIHPEHKIFRYPGGQVYARPNIPKLGRKEFPLGQRFVGEISAIDSKFLRKLVLIKERYVADLLRENQPVRPELARVEPLGVEIIGSKNHKADATFEGAEVHIRKHLLPWINEHAPYFYVWEERGETLWQQYIDFKRLGRPEIKFFNHRKHLGMILLRAFERGIIRRKVKLYDPDPKIDVGRALTDSEVRAVYLAASPATKVQILIAFTMGMRKSEILRLEWIRVDFSKAEIILEKRHTKTRRARVVPMTAEVLDALRARHKKQVGPYVFHSRYDTQSYQRSNKTAWNAAKRRAGVQARFHDLRHTFITNAIRSGVNPILISRYAGVSQAVMAEVYCHLNSADLHGLARGFGGNLGEILKCVQ